jgi:DNA-directed RNA polymerase I subunit RPA1
MANINQSIIRSRPTSIQFSIYTDDEVRQRSVCEISSSVSYDALGTPLPRGLYDPLLGPAAAAAHEGASTATEELCVTCGNVRNLCPGHFGHIELCVPVYHPLFFSRLIQLLKMKCLACHGFRLSKRNCTVYSVKLALIDAGRVGEACELDDVLAGIVGRTEGGGGGGVSSSNRGRKQQLVASSGAALDSYLNEKLASLSLSANESAPAALTQHERGIRRKILKEFQGACTKAVKCQNCQAFSPKIRHDQFNKVFQVGLARKNAKVS